MFPFPRRYLLKARKDEAITGLCMQPGFFMSKTCTKEQVWKRILFSQTLLGKNAAHKIAYIALTTALAVIVNALEIKLTVAQFSFTVFFSAFAGALLGGGAGFLACFLGDMIGFFLHPMGEYSPWIGISPPCVF